MNAEPLIDEFHPIRISYQDANNTVSCCDVLVNKHRQIFIVSEADENEGMSITNASETIATVLIMMFGFSIHRAVFIEHYPDGYWTGYPESYDMVNYIWKPGFGPLYIASCPTWTHLDSDELQTLLTT